MANGIFARSVRGFWISEDGRNWTEASDVPIDVHYLSSWADSVYSPTRVDWGRTSTDGGRTWSEPTLRPGGYRDPFTATDAGYFAIETVLFAPAVGVVWVSPDDVTWERVLNTWSPPYMDALVVSGDTILIPSVSAEPSVPLDWVGVIG